MTTADQLLTGVARDGFAELRERGAEAFRKLGLPTMRDEAWKFTSLQPLLRAELESGTPPERSRIQAAAGVTTGDLSLADERVQKHLGSLAKLDDALDALNAATFGEGAVVLVGDGQDVEEPVQIVHGATAAASHPRRLVVVGKNSRVRIVERFVGGEQPYLVNPVTEIVVGPGSTVEHVKVQQDGPQAFHLGSLHVGLDRDASFKSWSLSVGGRIARTRIEVRLDEGSDVDLTGLYLGAPGQTHDHHTTVDHTKPHARSRELYKGILDGGSRGVFTGKVIVRPDAQKTDSAQAVRNLLLGDDAVANARPQLEIEADDVKCAHGAAVGRLDEEALFYLRSRGLPLGEARKLLTYAFASEVVDAVPHEAVRVAIEAIVSRWLQRLEA
jgi:Fe-S cluster assembly protein SufD